MRYILMIGVFVCFASQLHAQFGFTGGLNMTSYNYKKNGAKQSRNSIITYNAGLVYRTPGKRFCLQPAVEYSVKGARNFDTNIGSGLDYYNNKLTYLQFTLPLIKKWTLVKKVSIDLGAGPYLASILKATSRAHSLSGSDKTTDFKIGNDTTDAFKRMDRGITFLFGSKMSHVGFFFLYDLGIANVDPIKNEVVKTRSFRINMSIYF